MARIRYIHAAIAEIPLSHAFATSQDRLVRRVSRQVFVQVALDNGRQYFGEAVPVAHVTGETPESVLSDVQQAMPGLIGEDVLRMRPLTAAISAALPESPTARAGLEMALYNANAGTLEVPLWRLLGGACTAVETDVTLSIVPDAPERAREASAAGIRTFKVKLGSPNPDEDLDRLIAVRAAVPDATFRLDANQAFTADGAIAFIRRAMDAGLEIELVEQPVPKDDLVALDRVARESPVPVLADEAVKSPADAMRLVRETCVHGINVKLMKSGIGGALDIVAIAQAAGLKLMIGCMLETRRGIAASLALACGTGAIDYVDLDSHMLLAEEGVNPYFEQSGGELRVLDAV